ncbi:TraB/GumN family protein [Sphingopyxis sp. RIFCSPHIGHO2_12_FULL_65_19]|uniref:ChaN family lipoprotein n=1 Tax=Sphingopyxis sp. RIFCSPHIGHO2_12_FULL_65_19 TaxID=1802172 RepID=UPI0008BEC3D3|nr:ChaN family lipoprotein [Sphingopyxis sp. RIFCSPHIGHO2_12_FULL_65_19]OHD09246.1 MAG: hypothetical protein A3E77_03365 [Sphingopyxis sp. RIFCSPHIGHO2_12_FULL_65_19]
MKTILFSVLAMVAAPADAPATTGCTPLPGAETLRDVQRPDFVIMGEAHGTAELPAAFADLVCAYAASGTSLTVGLEFLPAEQPALDAYLASNGDQAARQALLASPGWTIRDGRASQAIFDLVEALRKMKATHGDLAVVAFDHPSERAGTSAAREKGMAELLLAARRARPAAPVLALTGNGHAGKSEWTSLGPPFPAMSQLLPADKTLAISFHVEGGAIWACGRETPEAEETCGPRPIRVRGESRPRGISAGSSRKGFDATLAVGTAFSPSPPAKPAP